MKVEKQLSSKKQIQKLKKTIKKSNKTDIQPQTQQESIQAPKLEKKKVTVILVEANLLQYKCKSGLVLLSKEEHSRIIQKRLSRDPEEFRPEIIHQSVLQLLDSTLNKAGLLQVFIHTTNNEIIEISPQTKIPRTYKRFAGMIASLLQNRVIKTGEDNQILLRVVSAPPTLPEQSYVVGTSHSSKLVTLPEYIIQHRDKDLVFAVGATSKGHFGKDYPLNNDSISISRYQLSTANCLGKITNCFEDLYEIN